MVLHRGSTFFQTRYFCHKLESVVIVAATRTPWGKYKGQLASVSGLELGQLAVEAAVQQSAVSLEKIEQIFMNEKPELEKVQETDFIFSKLLRKAKYTPITVSCENEPKMDSLVKALESLKTLQQTAVVVGALESCSQKKSVNKSPETLMQAAFRFPEQFSEFRENYIAKRLIKHLKYETDGLYEAELVPLAIQQQEGKRRIIREINRDDIFHEKCEDISSFQCSDGAVALVLTTFARANELKLTPLAVITDFEYLRNSTNTLSCSHECVKNLFNKTHLDPQIIKHWEIEEAIPQLVVFLRDHFVLNLDVINPHGGSLIVGHSSATSLLRLITHLTHALKPTEYGCVVSANSQESLALIIRKLPSLSTPDSLPLLTLFTKDPCALCDVLIEELELNFPGEYVLKKVFIDTKENLRYLRLYRLDIPVVFLNNQFLCMHRLNHRLLRKKLDLLKK